MFEKLMKMQLSRCSGFFLASYVGVILGTIWILEPLLNGSSEDFLFAPGIVFSTAAFFAWTKGFDKLIRDAFCSPKSSLVMTLPVSEEALVDSEGFIGAFGSCLMYLCIGVTTLYMAISNDGMEATFLSLSALFVDLSYTAWTGAVSIGLIPILLFLEQVFTSMVILMAVLKCRNYRVLQKLPFVICLLILLLQVLGNIVIVANYKAIITIVHPLILEGGLALVLVLGTVVLRNHGIHVLKYRYND